MVFFLYLISLSGIRKIGSSRAKISYGAWFLLILILVQKVIGETQSSQFSKPATSESLWTSVAYFVSSLWGFGFLLDFRSNISRKSKSIPIIVFVFLLFTTTISISFLATGLPSQYNFQDIHLQSQVLDMTLLVYLLSGIALLYPTVIGTSNSILELVNRVRDIGLFPKRNDTNHGVKKIAIDFLVFPVLIGILSSQTPEIDLAGLASLCLLWFALILFIYKITHSQPRRKRPFSLPFHPLFPGITLTICLFLSLALPWESQGWGLVWLIIGGIFYWFMIRCTCHQRRDNNHFDLSRT